MEWLPFMLLGHSGLYAVGCCPDYLVIVVHCLWGIVGYTLWVGGQLFLCMMIPFCRVMLLNSGLG